VWFGIGGRLVSGFKIQVSGAEIGRGLEAGRSDFESGSGRFLVPRSKRLQTPYTSFTPMDTDRFSMCVELGILKPET
jgi:hypothetical protein